MGWIFLIVSSIAIVLLSKYKIIPPELKPYLFYPVIGISGFFIFIYSDPDTNPLISSLKGIWNTYGMISGIFGDTLSYIRLFALGTSSAILGFVVNTIGLQILNISYIGPVLFIVFLLLGHGLTIALSVLGAFVHPMRLTFVEFYKNAGFEGGGKAYNPFKAETNKLS
jgi:V/A-type H+-transporting ATPase subunit I